MRRAIRVGPLADPHALHDALLWMHRRLQQPTQTTRSHVINTALFITIDAPTAHSPRAKALVEAGVEPRVEPTRHARGMLEARPKQHSARGEGG